LLYMLSFLDRSSEYPCLSPAMFYDLQADYYRYWQCPNSWHGNGPKS
jgi:hypothetical protein